MHTHTHSLDNAVRRVMRPVLAEMDAHREAAISARLERGQLRQEALALVERAVCLRFVLEKRLPAASPAMQAVIRAKVATLDAACRELAYVMEGREAPDDDAGNE